ncbi:methionine ABC transporter permease [Actinopolymorpha alba]|uniref:methionine ABC transporter permease n=1 Tax=Actinopolymorpha alba TaxID=533267 RepID=UPI000378C296|nr:methionine ABC transporter permease [Actinopolymorpha alba]
MSHWQAVLPELAEATGATLAMVFMATLFTVVIGLPLGVLVAMTGRDGLVAVRGLHQLVAGLVAVGRSIPFVVLLIAAIPLTRAIVGTPTGTGAAVVPLTLGAVPFFAERVRASLRSVDRGVVEAAFAMGARTHHVLVTALLREGLPRMVSGLALTVVVLIGYSAIVGVLDGSGLGAMAMTYGYKHFETDVMAAIVGIFLVLTQGVKLVGDSLARRLDHRR